MTSFRIVAASLITAGLAIALTACAASTPSGSPTTTPAASSSSTSPRPSASTTAVPVDGQCDTVNLTGSIASGGGGAAGSVEVTLVLTNNGTAPCALQGWPGVSLVGDGNGTQLGAAAQFDRSTPHPTVNLAPGGTASAPLKIEQALNYSTSDCQPKPADGFRVYPPGSKESLFVKDADVTACASDSVSLLTVGALVQG